MFEKYRVNKFYKNNSNPNNLTIEEFEKLNENLKTKIINDERFYQLIEKLIENNNSFKDTNNFFDFISKYLPDNLALKLLENESFRNKFHYTHDTVKIINKVKDLSSKEKN